MNNRIVVVTGATGGLGPTVVAKFREAGDTVIAVARSGGDFQADLTDPQQASGLIQSVVAEHGRIDVLVHVWEASQAASRYRIRTMRSGTR